MASATGSGGAVRDAARDERKKTWGQQPAGWEPAHPGRRWRSGLVGLDPGLQGDADVDPPGGWALVFMAFMLTVAAMAWGIFLIG
jgi:hypothetical protein